LSLEGAENCEAVMLDPHGNKLRFIAGGTVSESKIYLYEKHNNSITVMSDAHIVWLHNMTRTQYLNHMGFNAR